MYESVLFVASLSCSFFSRVVASCHLEVTRPGPEVTSADHHMAISRQIKVVEGRLAYKVGY